MASCHWVKLCTAASSVPSCIQGFSFQSLDCSVSIKEKIKILTYSFLLHLQRAVYSKMFSKGKNFRYLTILMHCCDRMSSPFQCSLANLKIGNSQKMSLQSAAGVKHARCKKCLNPLIKDHQFSSSVQHLVVCSCPCPRCCDNLTLF